MDLQKKSKQITFFLLKLGSMAERLGRWDCNPSYEFNSLVTLTNSQLIRLRPVGILNLVGHNENYKLTSKLSTELSEVRTKRRLGYIY